MRKARLKEKDTDVFLQLEDTGKGALLLVEVDGSFMSQVALTPKQINQLRDWCVGFNDDFFKRNKVTSRDKK